MRLDLFPIVSQTTIRAERRPFLSEKNLLSREAYATPVNAKVSDIPDTELALVHLVGFLAPFMGLRLLKTYPHGVRHRRRHLDAVYLDESNGRQVRVEWENRAVSFIHHQHDPRSCDLLICWTDDFNIPQRKWIVASNPTIRVMDVNKILHHYEFVRSPQPFSL